MSDARRNRVRLRFLRHFLAMIREHKRLNPRKPRQIHLAETLKGELLHAQK